MMGIDPGTIAQNFITYFGGASGGLIAGAAALITYLLCAAHVLHPRAGWTTVTLIVGAWISAWLIRGMIGWA